MCGVIFADERGRPEIMSIRKRECRKTQVAESGKRQGREKHIESVRRELCRMNMSGLKT